MKKLLPIVFLGLTKLSFAQYYYKDIIGTRQTENLIKSYISNKVNHVLLTSYDAENTKNDDFYVEQEFNGSALKTITRSSATGESILTSFMDTKGRVRKTIDSSETVISNTTYEYNSQEQLSNVQSVTTDSSGNSESERHIWQYAGSTPTAMVRIKNNTDTTFISFKTDERGNVSEEQGLHKGIKSEPVFYYYDEAKRLTDIVQYNKRAKRLLPEYMFEYSPANQVIQQITVPANSSDYIIWRYQYDAKGLKVREAIYNKQKQLTGKIEYQYSFNS
ncbi:MAG TPA: hypothetical protein VFQ58_03460 [Flavisolibacter sp.]|nr:hypothetical protein [Flavisolibacter sp.]